MIALQWLLSLIFIIQMYLAMAAISILFAPWAMFSRRGAVTAAHFFSRWVLVSARILCGLKVEVRGTPPQHECLIAAKHQSFLDILAIYDTVPMGKFIMKHELIWTPFLGQYALMMGCIPVDRGKRGAAVAKMKEDVAKGSAYPGQVIIYPQGTRVAPGDVLPYKGGTALLYEQLGQECIPVATNVGLFWPKRSILRKRGTAVIEFLPAIPPGLRLHAFMDRLQAEVETASDALMAEAGFSPRK